ncbi:MAG TPA: aminoglycoside phosphotransferase family protein [Candidatus Limnocylindrales bacterium]
MSDTRYHPPPRRVTLELVTPEGEPIGRLPEVPVDEPWWPDVQAIVAAARERYGLEVVVLRMLDTERPTPHGGGVTYLAEISTPIARSPLAAEALLPFGATLDEQPLRLRYAKPGGPGLDLAWAEEVLAARRIERDGPAEQMRTWNLSSIWRLPLADGHAAWLKVVPPFFAHEGDMLRRLQGDAVPRLLGHDGDRVLLADVDGEDLYDAAEPERLEMVSMLVALQTAWIGRIDDLLRIGLPDWRGPALTPLIADVVLRRSPELPAADASTLSTFVAGMPARYTAIAQCGLPDTLVHGDFHPGNVRGRPGKLTMLDWGDAGVGHPLLDLPAFLGTAEPASRARIRAHWFAAWGDAVPGCDPERADELIEPVAIARQAVIYQAFVDSIEPVERRHHDADVIDRLTRTAAAARSE